MGCLIPEPLHNHFFRVGITLFDDLSRDCIGFVVPKILPCLFFVSTAADGVFCQKWLFQIKLPKVFPHSHLYRALFGYPLVASLQCLFLGRVFAPWPGMCRGWEQQNCRNNKKSLHEAKRVLKAVSLLVSCFQMYFYVDHACLVIICPRNLAKPLALLMPVMAC